MRYQFTLTPAEPRRGGMLGPVVGLGALLVVVGLTYFVGCGERTPKPADAEEVPAGDTRADVAAVTPAPRRVLVVTGPITFERGDSAFQDGRYGEAVAIFTAYTEAKPDNPWGHYMLGLSAWKSGDPAGAERSFARALELDSTHVKSQLNLSRVLIETGRAEEAMPFIEKALQLDTAASEGFRLLGRAYSAMGCEEEAVDAYKHAVAVGPTDVWAMNNLGLTLIQQGRFEEAIGPLARATSLSPDVPVFQNNLGIALERTGHYVAAGRAFEAALAVDSTYQKAAVNLARVGALTEDPSVGPIDLGAYVVKFLEEMELWKAERDEHGC